MKKITKLHNKHKGQEIWVVGSDPTLEDYPDNFLDGKLSITVHLAHMKFPNATYRYFNEKDRFLFLKDKYPDFLDKISIFGFPFYNRTPQESEEEIKKVKESYFLNSRPYPPKGNFNDIFSDVGTNAMEKMVTEAIEATSNIFGGHGTCIHNAMYVAIMMGGNPINVIGANFRAAKGKEHFGEAQNIDHKMRPTTASFTGYRGTRMTRGLNAIIAGCKAHNIKVNWIEKYDTKTKQLVYKHTELQTEKVSKTVSKTVSEFTPL